MFEIVALAGTTLWTFVSNGDMRLALDVASDPGEGPGSKTPGCRMG